MAIIPDKEARCRQIEQLIANGHGVCESCRRIGISERTFNRWQRAKRDTPQRVEANPL